MDWSEPGHRKTLGIAYIVLSILGLIGLAFYDFFMSFVLDLVVNDPDFDPNFMWIFDFINKFVWGVGILFLVPRLLIGFGLVNLRKWAETPALIYGVISLINIPVGTILGIYAIIVLTSKPKNQEEFIARNY